MEHTDPPRFLAPFLAHCTRRSFRPKQEILRPGDPADQLFYIVEGSVTILIEDDDGREMILAYLNAGQFIGEIGLFSATPPERSVVVRTRSDCTVAEIHYARLQQLLQDELSEHAVAILFALGRQLSERLLHTSRKVGALAFLDVTGRVARTLLDLSTEPEAVPHEEGTRIRVTRQELSRIVGCSREMAGRVLKSLEEDGLVRMKGQTILLIRRTEGDE